MVALAPLDISVIVAYLVLLIGIGVFVSYRRRGEEDQFLAGRSFGWFNVGLSIYGTNVSPSFMIASASAAYATGMATANFEWLAWVTMMLLAMVFAPHYLNSRIGTMPEFIRQRFGTASANYLSCYALFSTVVLWLGGTTYAGGLLLSQLLGWPLWLSLAALLAVATFLTVAGGLAVIIVTDTFQSILMLAGIGTLTAFGLHAVGGVGALIEKIPAEHWSLIRPASDPDYPWHAMFLGCIVTGTWFWCTDQTIVQRVLGARDLRQGQLGVQFAAYLKVITPVIFMTPGLICFALYPDLEDSDEAFMTMVNNHLPVGMLGLVVAVLVAALISTVDSALNSFSTIFTLDVYKRWFVPNATEHHLKHVGRFVTLCIALAAFFIALSLDSVGKNLFELLQGIIAYFSPPMAAVFLIGVLWKRATSKAALITLVVGSVVSVGIGVLAMNDLPRPDFWPHFMLMAFLLFAALCALMIVVSFCTRHSAEEGVLPSLRETYAQDTDTPKTIWLGWAILAIIMLTIYGVLR